MLNFSHRFLINFQNLPLFKINLLNLQITFWFLKQFWEKTDNLTDETLFSFFFEGIELSLAFYNLLQNLIWLYDLKFTKFTFVILENLILGWWFGYSRNCSLSVRQKLVKGDLIYSKWLNFFYQQNIFTSFFSLAENSDQFF